jgi:hypothetical protein
MEDSVFGPAQTVTFEAFGHTWVNYPAGLAEDLVTLEREGAVYSHFADRGSEQPDGTATFSYYRVPLLPAEVFQFVEASIAYQEFHAALAGGASFDAALLAIANPEIAERVKTYGGYGREDDGTRVDIRGCHASFYPDGMEDLLCGHERDRYEALPEVEPSRERLALVMQVVNAFPVVERILKDRGHGRPSFLVENEYDLQDLLFSVLRSVFEDVQREEWTPKQAGSAKRIDIVIPSADVVIETKFVRDKAHGKAVADELRIDFESYHAHQHCRNLIAVCLDPGDNILDPAQFESGLSGLRKKDDHEFNVTVLVR